VQQVMLSVLIQLLHVTAQAVGQHLIVSHALMIHMVYAVIQHVAAILAVTHMIMVLLAQPVKLVVVVLVVYLSQLDLLVSIAPQHIIAAMGLAVARRLAQALLGSKPVGRHARTASRGIVAYR